MAEKDGNKSPRESELTLGEELRQIRELHRLSLRAVENVTQISNAYLSQLETGKIDKPSPNFLYKLAELYGVPYEQLMEKAGYIVRRDPDVTPAKTLSGAALAAMSDLSPEEEHALMEYLAFLRSRRQR